MNMPDEIWMHVEHGALSCHERPISAASVAFVPLLRAVKAAATIARLEEALALIAAGTICPDLFPSETNEDAMAAKTAMTIAMAALEVSATQAQRVSNDKT